MDNETCTETKDTRASAASVNAGRCLVDRLFSPFVFAAVTSANTLEKNNRDVSSIGWNTIRAIRDPATWTQHTSKCS